MILSKLLHTWRTALFSAVLLTVGLTANAQDSIFTVQKSPNPNVQGNTLNAVAALSPTDAWAVGYKNDNNLNESRTLTLHWDGVQWKTISSPNPGSTPECTGFNTGNVLNAVAAISSNDVWAVGFSFTCSTLLKPMAMHWDGTKWHVVRTPQLRTNDNSAFNGIFAFASNDIYAVGYKPAINGAVKTLIEHWDGASWQVVSSPNGNSTGNVLSGISATSPTDIWAVGDMVAPNVPVKTLVLHFNGSKWSVVPSPNPIPTGDLGQNVLLSVQAVSPDDVTAAGFILDFANQRELTLIEHWGGKAWTVIPSPNRGESRGDFNRLTSLAAVSGNNLYAAGFFANADTAGEQETLVEHFDGTSWSIISSPTKGAAQQLNGAFALQGTQDLWMVGAFSTFGDDPETGFLIVPKTLVFFSSND